MSFNNPMTRLRPWTVVLLACGPFLAGCAGDGIKGVAEATGLATTPQESKPFVKQARRADADYIPVGSSVTRTAPRKPVADFKTLETQLEAKRLSNEAAGNQAKVLGATPPPAPAVIPTN
jgi:hypothetical protein